jgi:hypothetical protein
MTLLIPLLSSYFIYYTIFCQVFCWYNTDMSGTIKTLQNDNSVEDFINSVENDVKRRDSFTLLGIYKQVTGLPPKMWGSSIIGFGQYHYKSERSRQEGDWPLTGFSPRKQNLTLYVMPGFKGYEPLLNELGKHKTSVSCLCINKLSDIDIDVLRRIIEKSYTDARETLL